MKLTTVEYNQLVEKSKKVAVPGLRQALTMKIGQVVRQGDIYIHKVKDSHPHGERLKNHQLAQGLTMGSRHIADETIEVYEGVKLPEWVARNHFLGPLLVCKKATSLISHPEHSNIALGEGCFQVTMQMDIRTMKRVQD